MKRYAAISKQIKTMKYRGLAISDKPFTRKLLQSYGYHEVVNGYQYLFKNKQNLTENFDDGIDFIDIANAFYLDAQLRMIIRKSIEQFEMTFKEAVAEYFSKEIGEEQANHLNRDYFVTGKMHTPRKGSPYSDLDFLQRKVKHALNSKDKLIIHHKKKGNIPPWILYKNLTLGEMKTYFTLLKSGEIKDHITRRMMQSEFIEFAGMELAKSYLIELLNFVHEYRNLASHANRIFDYAPNEPNDGLKTVYKLFPDSFTKFDRKEGYGKTGIFAMMLGFSTLSNSDPFITLNNFLQEDIFPALFSDIEGSFFGNEVAYAMRFPLSSIRVLTQTTKFTPPKHAKKHY